MRATLPSVCPHDCPSQCALQVTVEAGRITDVTGEGIWWSKHQPGGRGVNALTDDRTTDMGGGPALHSNLVQVERLGPAR